MEGIREGGDDDDEGDRFHYILYAMTFFYVHREVSFVYRATGAMN